VMKDYPERRRCHPARHQRGAAARTTGRPISAFLQRTMAGIVDHPKRRRLRDPESRLRGQPADRSDRVDRSRQRAPADGAHDSAGRRLSPRPSRPGSRRSSNLPVANQAQREPIPRPSCGRLQCGGSDGWSGGDGEPGSGQAADEIVRQGGTVCWARRPRSTAASTS
jgi:hypothetical protein